MLKLGLIVAVALATVSTTANAVVLAQLDPVALDTTAISTSGSTPAQIDFVNHLSYAVDVYWINYSGDRVFYNDLAAHSGYVQGTFITHPWIIAKVGSGDTLAQGTGTLITGFLAATPSSAGLAPDVANIGAIPEPASWTMLISGLALTGVALRRRRPVAAQGTGDRC